MRMSQTQFFGTWFLELSKHTDGFKYQPLDSLKFWSKYRSLKKKIIL